MKAKLFVGQTISLNEPSIHLPYPIDEGEVGLEIFDDRVDKYVGRAQVPLKFIRYNSFAYWFVKINRFVGCPIIGGSLSLILLISIGWSTLRSSTREASDAIT